MKSSVTLTFNLFINWHRYFIELSVNALHHSCPRVQLPGRWFYVQPGYFILRAELFYFIFKNIYCKNYCVSGGFAEFSLTAEPFDTIVVDNRPLTLDCVAHYTDDSGTRMASVHWFKDSQPFVLSPPNKSELLLISLLLDCCLFGINVTAFNQSVMDF